MTKTSKRLVSPLLAFQALVVTSYYYTENVILSQIFLNCEYGRSNRYCIVGRGPVPRHAWDYRTIARDRPSRYGNGNPYLQHVREGQALALRNWKPLFTPNAREGQALALRNRKPLFTPNAREGQALALRNQEPLMHRRAGACPPPCLGLPNVREGQALALRKRKPLFTTRSRGTGPRATAWAAVLLAVWHKHLRRIFLINKSLFGKIETLDKEE